MSNPTELPDLDKLEALARAATPGPWAWWTSNSVLRLSADDGIDGGVLHAYSRRSHADICCGESDRAFIAAANPAAVLALIALARRAQPEGEAPQADDVARKELLLALQAVLDTCATKSGAPKMSHLGTLAALNTAIDVATRAAPAAQHAESGAPVADERAAFEAMFSGIHPAAKIPAAHLFERVVSDSRYCSLEVEYAWQTYRAALASRPAAENMVLGKQPEIATETAETRMDTGFHDAGQIASRPAEVDDEGLPPLRTPEFCAGDLESGEPVYTAEQYRQGQRDAVAAYKRQQVALQQLADQAQELDMGYGAAPSHTTNKEK